MQLRARDICSLRSNGGRRGRFITPLPDNRAPAFVATRRFDGYLESIDADHRHDAQFGSPLMPVQLFVRDRETEVASDVAAGARPITALNTWVQQNRKSSIILYLSFWNRSRPGARNGVDTSEIART